MAENHERRIRRLEVEQRAVLRAQRQLGRRVAELEEGQKAEQRVERRVLALIPAIAVVLAAIIGAVAHIITSGGIS